LLLLPAAAACGQAASSSSSLPSCGPAQSSPVSFAPTSVSFGAYGCGPGVCDAGTEITASDAAGDSLQIKLPNWYSSSTPQVLCFATTSIQGSFSSGMATRPVMAALISFDAYDPNNAQTNGRVLHAWFMNVDTPPERTPAFAFKGNGMPVP
jgi:hypothetical protein